MTHRWPSSPSAGTRARRRAIGVPSDGHAAHVANGRAACDVEEADERQSVHQRPGRPSCDRTQADAHEAERRRSVDRRVRHAHTFRLIARSGTPNGRVAASCGTDQVREERGRCTSGSIAYRPSAKEADVAEPNRLRSPTSVEPQCHWPARAWSTRRLRPPAQPWPTSRQRRPAMRRRRRCHAPALQPTAHPGAFPPPFTADVPVTRRRRREHDDRLPAPPALPERPDGRDPQRLQVGRAALGARRGGRRVRERHRPRKQQSARLAGLGRRVQAGKPGPDIPVAGRGLVLGSAQLRRSTLDSSKARRPCRH